MTHTAKYAELRRYLLQLQFKLIKADYGLAMPRDERLVAHLQDQIAQVEALLEDTQS